MILNQSFIIIILANLAPAAIVLVIRLINAKCDPITTSPIVILLDEPLMGCVYPPLHLQIVLHPNQTIALIVKKPQVEVTCLLLVFSF